MDTNKKIIILLIYAISLLSFTTLFTYSRYNKKIVITDTIITKELKIEFEKNGDSTLSKVNGSIVNIVDTHSDYLVSLKYVWSLTNNTSAENGTEFTSGDNILNTTLSGTYYLCVYALDDKGFYNNTCSNAFNFDNTAPTVTFTYDDNNIYKHSQSSIVTVTNDEYGAELDLNSIKYVWTKNINVEPTESFTSGDTLTKNTGAGDYYLIVNACDAIGNCTKAQSSIFKIDNEGPAVTLTTSSTADMRAFISYNAVDNETGIVGYNITTTDTEPTSWQPILEDVSSSTEVKQEYGATWARIFHHNNKWGEIFFANSTEALSSNTSDKYSVLNDLEKYKLNDKFEFLLEYPEISDTQYNRWTQTANPTNTSIASGDGTANAPGYTPVHIDWTGNYWGGLVLSNANTSTYVDGSVGHGNWFYAIGTYTPWNNGMPGPNSTAVSSGDLWVRIDGLVGTNKKNTSGKIGGIKSDGKYYVWFKDELGNVSKNEINVERKYLIRFNPNGGTFNNTTNSTLNVYNYTNTVNVSDPTRAGYIFTGWSNLATAKGVFADLTEYSADNTSGTSIRELKQFTVSPNFAAGEVYQLDFDAKGTGSLTTYFYGASNYLQISSVSNSDGYNGTGTDGYNTVALTNSYKHYNVRFVLGSTGSGTVTKYILFRLFGGNSASIKNVKFNKIDASSKVYTSSNIDVKKNTLLHALWIPSEFAVTCEDWFVDASNNGKVKLGSSAKVYTYGATASGADWGTDATTSKYYSGYVYKSATSATVPTNNSLVVYRRFHAWTDLNIYYAGGTTQGGATVALSTNNSNYTDVTNEVNTVQPWGTTYYIKNIRPKNSYEELDRVQNLTYNSAGYYTYTPTTAGTSMNIYMKFKNYSISYNLNGGSVSGNPTSYNYSSAAFTLKNPTRGGYTFSGWTGTGLSAASTSVTVPTHSTGNRSYTANWTANSYYLDLNGLINNTSTGGISGCGTADVYINGALKANDVADYYTQWPTGTKYEIKDIKATTGCTYNGVASGSLSGTITTGNVGVQLKYTFSSRDFGYSGGVQSFVVPVAGTYKLEVWGAQGGASLDNGNVKDIGGKGGYSVGNVSLTTGATIYVIVGGKGGQGSLTACAPGGYNGGGQGTNDGGGCGNAEDDEASGGGGGATHIGTRNGTLAQYGNTSGLYIVAGGGGGGSFNYAGGAGGGTNGGTNTNTSGSYPTQSGGAAFGQGQNGSGKADSDGVAGGGGGLYGGYANNVSRYSAGTGGSGYIGGVSGGSTTAGQRTGNGYARITKV